MYKWDTTAFAVFLFDCIVGLPAFEGFFPAKVLYRLVVLNALILNHKRDMPGVSEYRKIEPQFRSFARPAITEFVLPLEMDSMVTQKLRDFHFSPAQRATAACTSSASEMDSANDAEIPAIAAALP